MARIDIGLLITARDRVTGPFRRMRQSFSKTTKEANKMRRGIKSIDLVLGAIAIGSVIAVTKNFVKMGAEMEALRFRIGIFERSAEGADRVMKELQETFKNVPFDLKTIGDGFVRLRAAGVDPLDGSLKSLIDAVAAFGGGSQELQRATIAIQQMAGKGVVSMEEMRQQLGEAIPFAMRIMADEMGISVAEFISDVERGTLSAREGFGALFGGLQKKFGGIADAMVNTMGGAFQALVKEVQAGADKIFNEFGVADIITLFLQDLTSGINDFVGSLDPEQVRNFAFGLRDAAVEAGKVIIEIGKIGIALGQMSASALSSMNLSGAVIITAGILGAFLLGPTGALAALVGASVAVIIVELNKLDKAFFGFENSRSLGGGNAFVGDDFVARAKETVKAVAQTKEEFMRATAQSSDESRIAQIRAEREAALTKAGALGESGGLSGEGQKRLIQLENSIKSITAKLKGSGELPFIQQLERMRQIAKEAAVQFDLDSEALVRLKGNLSKAQESGDPVLIEAAERSLRFAQRGFKKASQVLGEQRGLAEQFLVQGLDKASRKVQESVGKIANQLKQRAASLTGDIFGDAQERAAINATFDEMNNKIEKQLRKATEIVSIDSERAGLIRDANEALAQSNSLREEELQKVTRVTEARKSLFNIEQANVASQITRDISSDLRDLSNLGNPLADSFTPDVVERARQMREEITGTVESLNARVSAIRLEATENNGITEQQREQIDLLNQRIGVLGDLRSATTSAALASKQVWSEVGATLQSGIADTLVSIVDQNKSLKDIATDAFNSITRAAADYLAQLLLIKVASAGVFGGAGGGAEGFAGLLFGGFGARGGVARGGVKPFANGGILKGPTLFGLAGEAGDEAILPLTNVGGKQGVSAEGLGSNVNLSIQAIDTQTGTKFLMDHLADISGGFQGATALNEGVR